MSPQEQSDFLKPILVGPFEKIMARFFAYLFIVLSLAYLGITIILAAIQDDRFYKMHDISGFTAALAGVGFAFYGYYNINRADEIAQKKITETEQRMREEFKEEINEHMALVSEATQNMLYGIFFLHLANKDNVQIEDENQIRKARENYDDGKIDKDLIEQARCNFEEAICIYKQVHDGNALLGDLYLSIGEPSLAEEKYNDAIANNDKQYYNFLNKARFLMLFKGREQEALSCIQKALQTGGDRAAHAIECVPKYRLLLKKTSVQALLSQYRSAQINSQTNKTVIPPG